MRVRCISTTGKDLTPEYLSADITNKTVFQLTLGRVYVVYAIDYFEGQTWYFIADDAFVDYPRPVPAVLFEVVDDSQSPHWLRISHPHGLTTVGFKEWTESVDFYERLVDGEPIAVSAFSSYKRLMDEESTQI